MAPPQTAIGLTLGDPTGIGPEIVLGALAEAALPCEVVVYGDEGVLARTARSLGLPLPAFDAGRLRLRALTTLSEEESAPGRPGPASGAAQLAYLEAAIADARAGLLGGLCTAPIHKASAIAAGLGFPGHTELLRQRLGSPGAVMMLCGPSLRVALCTTHLALREVPEQLSVAGVAAVIVATARGLVHDFGMASPRVLIAGLNPHAGEGGHFGREEIEVISPAIERARHVAGVPGLMLSGPHVPDAVFRQAVHGAPRADAVVAMYHDQGLIPLKLLDFDRAVNVTLGLPIARTSPDHGTAHDIAGKGIARATSLCEALRLCAEIMGRRTRRGRDAR